MNSVDIQDILNDGKFDFSCSDPKLMETHISWVILCDEDVFKIKKPVKYDFLDFSTVDKRRYYCREEVRLNNRLTSGMYLGTVPVKKNNDRYGIGGSDGVTIDYAVHMKKIPEDRRMDVLLDSGGVGLDDIRSIADKLISFHRAAKRFQRFSMQKLLTQVNAIQEIQAYAIHNLGDKYGAAINGMVEFNRDYLDSNKPLLEARVKNGYIRDCHGDLHSRNIFLTAKPLIFDCIEFNPAFRRLDLLNELAFFCMDLESHGEVNLSDVFFDYYNSKYPVCNNESEHSLFIFYKAYRANVRAKVNILRAMSAKANKPFHIEARRYLNLMMSYHHELISLSEH